LEGVKTTTIPIVLGSKRWRIVLHSYSSRDEYRSKWRWLLSRSRAHCYKNRRRRGYLCHIHYVAGDLEALMHELHHAACEAVRQGCVAGETLSRRCHEERVAVAHGVIGGAVWRRVAEKP
jgi:hypothetical protein